MKQYETKTGQIFKVGDRIHALGVPNSTILCFTNRSAIVEYHPYGNRSKKKTERIIPLDRLDGYMVLPRIKKVKIRCWVNVYKDGSCGDFHSTEVAAENCSRAINGDLAERVVLEKTVEIEVRE